MLQFLSKTNCTRLAVWVVIVGSLLVATWTRAIDPVINPDGVKYVLAAEAFKRGDFAAGLDAYKWPMYSLVVAAISKVTTLGAEVSAIIFNAIMRVLAGLAFLRLSSKFGASEKQLLLAALVFIFYPGLNEVQSMIIRDIAYIGCFMWMVVFFLQQINDPTSRNLSGFIICGLLAISLRIEGLVFLIGLCLFYLTAGTLSRRLKIAGLLSLLVSLPLLVAGLFMWIYDGEIGGGWTLLVSMLENMAQDLEDHIASVETGWLRGMLEATSWLILLFTPFVKLFYNLVEITTLGYSMILVVGYLLRPMVMESQPRIALMLKGWRWIVGINLLVLVGFVLIRQIVTDRYPLSLSMMLILFVPFAISRIFELSRGWTIPWARTAIAVMAVLLAINSIEGLDRFSSKLHLREAGLWIREQAGEYDSGDIYINDRVVDYYAGKDIAERDIHYSYHNVNAFALTPRWTILEFFAVSLNNKGSPGFYRNFRYRIGKEPDMVFENERGAKVLVYDFRDLEDKL